MSPATTAPMSPSNPPPQLSDQVQAQQHNPDVENDIWDEVARIQQGQQQPTVSTISRLVTIIQSFEQEIEKLKQVSIPAINFNNGSNDILIEMEQLRNGIVEPQQRLFITNIIDTIDQLKNKLNEKNKLIDDFKSLNNKYNQLKNSMNETKNENEKKYNDLLRKYENLSQEKDGSISNERERVSMELTVMQSNYNDLKQKWEIKEPFNINLPNISNEKQIDIENHIKNIKNYHNHLYHFIIKIHSILMTNSNNDTNINYLMDKLSQGQAFNDKIILKLKNIFESNQDTGGNNDSNNRTSLMDSLTNTVDDFETTSSVVMEPKQKETSRGFFGLF